MSLARHSVFSVNVFSDHSIILRKLSERQDGGVVRLLVNGFFLTPLKWVTSPTWGHPPPCKQA